MITNDSKAAFALNDAISEKARVVETGGSWSKQQAQRDMPWQ